MKKLNIEGGEVKKYTLVKTDKTVKIEPADLVDLYRYVKYFIDWETDDLTKKLNEIFPHRKLPEYSKRIRFWSEKAVDLGTNVYIPLNSILLPSYIYTRISKRIENSGKPKGREKVSINNLSFLDVYQVAPSPEGKFESINLVIQITHSSRRNRYVINSLELDFEYEHSGKSRRLWHYLIRMPFFGVPGEEFEIGKCIETMKQLEGTKYSKLDTAVLGSILEVELSLVLVLNLLYVLHSNEFNENDMIDSLFKKHSDLVKGSGCKFEDFISAVKLVPLLLL
jgi:hypothetical protein